MPKCSFKFDACYRSQIVGTGAVYHSVASPLLFQTVWRRLGIEVMSFLEFGVGIWSPILGLIQVSSCWRVRGRLWHIFRLMMIQMFSIGERSGLQAGQFSTWTLLLPKPCCCNSCSMWFSIKDVVWSICCSKTFIYLSACIVPSRTCKLPIPFAIMHPHTIRDAGFWTEHW